VRQVPLLVVALVSLAGCGAGGVVDESGPLPTSPTSTVVAPPSTLAAASSPTTLPVTSRSSSTTMRPASTTTSRPLTRTEATAKLCGAVGSAADAIGSGSFVAGGWRLSSALTAYEKAADPAVATAARQMLRAGLDGDAEAYLDARSAASDACARAGSPIRISGPIQCVTTPCP
jgi:hypothetical protein